MSAKFIWMSDKLALDLVKGRRNKLLWGKPFKWQWALFYKEKTYRDGTWVDRMIIFHSRSEARAFKHSCLYDDKWIRNVKMKRRLVQANWDDYNDSFSYNAKGNGNGQ